MSRHRKAYIAIYVPGEHFIKNTDGLNVLIIEMDQSEATKSHMFNMSLTLIDHK